MDEFEKWLEGLELQTLTDELKETILRQVWLAYDDGYETARVDIIESITNL